MFTFSLRIEIERCVFIAMRWPCLQTEILMGYGTCCIRVKVIPTAGQCCHCFLFLITFSWFVLITHLHSTRNVSRTLHLHYKVCFVDQVAQAARRLATGWAARIRSRVSEDWRFFFTYSCPDWSWGSLSLLQNRVPGLNTADRRTCLSISS